MPFTRGRLSSNALIATQPLVSGAAGGGLLYPGGGCLPVKPVIPRVLQHEHDQRMLQVGDCLPAKHNSSSCTWPLADVPGNCAYVMLVIFERSAFEHSKSLLLILCLPHSDHYSDVTLLLHQLLLPGHFFLFYVSRCTLACWNEPVRLVTQLHTVLPACSRTQYTGNMRDSSSTRNHTIFLVC